LNQLTLEIMKKSMNHEKTNDTKGKKWNIRHPIFLKTGVYASKNEIHLVIGYCNSLDFTI
jgi:hypothetical protein